MTIIPGTCSKCVSMQKEMPGYCCVFCATGLKADDKNVTKDKTTGTVTIDLSDPNHSFWGRKQNV